MSFRGKNLVYIDGVVTDSIGIYVKDRPEVPTAEQIVDSIEVRGRDGSLTKKYGYKDIVYPITFHMYEDGDGFMTPFRLIKSKILATKVIQFADDMDVFYRVKSVSIDSAYNPTKEFGRFTVYFTLDPFMYAIENNPISITQDTTINNEGHESLPILKAIVNGIGRIYVNDDEIVINGVNGQITIDSEQSNAYREGNPPQNMNNKMVGEFPVLKSGENLIRYTGDITELTITLNKRWV